ncbi:MAG TPA: hypothetical protein PLV55_01465 [Anaerohalosphaeraceae bacterium]|nr:hypothetical protein [Anaerohalosphaeraceae bacterium]HOL88779.1 hypothetical protein [Anaerohalosphaeraceae bacterium]
MGSAYSLEMIQRLQEAFRQLGLHRPMQISRYEPGTQLHYAITPLPARGTAHVRVQIERFVGGGFAGQVYQIRLLEIVENGQPVPEFAGLKTNNLYAMKILIPPSGAGRLFRDLLYAVGFQGPFQPQVNPAAARAGALWQTFIRQAAAERFGDTECVNEIYATFIDPILGSCGEISRWIDGRTWRLEVDDRLDLLRLWRKGRLLSSEQLGSPEYRAKYVFMHEFVRLLYEMGAYEFARQYEWSTCKSQPNCLKRLETNNDPQAGLVAVDFRAGLTLLPFLPMSPGDFKLIAKGIARGSMVQFDRGDLAKLERYIREHPQAFASMPYKDQMLRELKECEEIYRNSIPDITHNHIRLLTDGRLWSTMLSSAVTSWRVRGQIDAQHETVLRGCAGKTLLFWMLGLLPLLGRVLRKAWGRPDWRSHYLAILSSPAYLGRAVIGKIYEMLIGWYRKGRLSEKQVEAILRSPWRFWLHLPLAILPAGLHRFFTDKQVFLARLHSLFVRPIQLYFQPALREQWLRDMVQEGQKKQILSDEDAATILSQIKEPFIQRYLMCLVLHLLTLPLTQVVSVAVGAVYYFTHPEAPPEQRAMVVGGILVFFQIIPISPGSFARGLITTIMAIHDRSFRDYNIALFLSYFKYIGYLAFPIQMTYRYPALARFMAAHWATDAVHIVPVFGERGALLEHGIFRLFYNWPLTIRRRMPQIARMRLGLRPRLWPAAAAFAAAAVLMILSHLLYYTATGLSPAKENFWYLRPLLCPAVLIPAAAGWIASRFAGGLARSKRFAAAAIGGLAAAALYSLGTFVLEQSWELPEKSALLIPLLWREFVFTLTAGLGAAAAEITEPSPDITSFVKKD